MLSRTRVVLAAAVVVAAAVAVAALRLPALSPPPAAEDPPGADLGAEVLPALRGAGGWLNGDRTALDSLAGRPVVVALWSDTDPRSLDALPRFESWHQAYARFGVRVIGVHAPEFSFGVDPAVPARVARRLRLGFPIALDPSYQVRSRLGPLAAGGVVLTGADGRVALAADLDQLDRVDHAIRAEIRRLHPGVGFPLEAEPPAEAPSRDIRLVHLGAGRAESGPLARAVPGRPTTFTTQFRYQEEGRPYVPHPVGRWMPTAEGVTAERGGAAEFVSVRSAGDAVGAVLSPGAAGASRVWIMADHGWLPEASRGEDVVVDGRGAAFVDVTEPRLYRITRPGEAHVLRFSPREPGLTIHAFTFERAAGERPGS